MPRKVGKSLKNKHTLVVPIPGMPKPVRFKVPMSDAVKPVVLERREIDAFNGKPGLAIECMNAQCANRLHKAFPHPVHYTEFTDTRAYVVDKLDRDGHPAHLIRYYHHEGDEQKEFDRKGGKQRLIRSGKVNKTFALLAPTASTKHLASIEPGIGKGGQLGPRNSRTHRKGSFARATRAGILQDISRDAA